MKREIKNIRDDYKLLRKNKKLIFFNSSATSLKPDIFIKKISDIYFNWETSFSKSSWLDENNNTIEEYKNSLNKVAKHINAPFKDILPTYGTTDFMNKIVRKIIHNLNDGDEIILGKLEHASNILPWLNIAKEFGKKIIFKWYKLNNWKVDLIHLNTLITKNTKVMSVAHVYNTTGVKNNLLEIKNTIGNNITLVVDGAQGIGHVKIDVIKDNVDYYLFGAHKAFGPHALGFAYIKNLENIKEPWTFGGGNNSTYNEYSVEYKEGKQKFIVGTRDVPGVISFGTSITYIESFGIKNIEKYNNNLKKYAEKKIGSLKNINIINKNVDSSNLFFEVNGVAGEDVGYYLAQNEIIVRTGTNCVKCKNENYKQYKSIRVSFHIYNTKKEIDKFYELIKSGGDFLESLFKKNPKSKICK